MRSVRDLVEEFQNRNGTAIVDRKEFRTFRYSYQEFDSLIRRCATLLTSKGVIPEDRVMLWAPNSAEYAAMLLAIMSLRAVAVPIDVRQGVDFFKRVEKQVSPKLIVHSRIRPIASSRAILIEDVHWMIEALDETIFSPVHPDALCQLLFTSGTTSDPKGVMLTHDNVVQDVAAALTTQYVSKRDRFLSILPLSHVFEQIVNLFIPLSSKSTIVYIESIKPSSIFRAIRKEQVSRLAVVPRVLALFKTNIEANLSKAQFKTLTSIPKSFRARVIASMIRKHFGKIKNFYCGGAPLSIELESFFETIGIPIVQGYGLTETTAILATNSVHDRLKGSVGKVLPGVQVKITSQNEILVKGRTVTQGYYKLPDASNASFKDGWFHTGDLGKIEKGHLFLLGRKKDVIVTSAGVNVYPIDVEHALREVRGVKDAAVVAKKQGVSEEVHAFVLPTADTATTKSSLKKIVDAANSKLDSAQAITSFEFYKGDDFPRTTTMKVQKNKLVVTAASRKPRKSLLIHASKVRQVLSKMSSKKITDGATLRNLGLSSIDRVDLLNRLEQEFAVDFDDNMIAADMTVKKLEEFVKHRKSADKREVTKFWPLSPLVRLFRTLAQEIALLPIVRFFGTPHVEGMEYLDKIKGPAFFIANHQSHLDVPIILMALPWRLKRKLAIGVWQQFFFDINRKFHGPMSRVSFYMTLMFWNGFPFSQRKWFRRSARHAGWLVDHGWNIMLFPEGVRSTTGKIGTFRGAIGLFAKEMRIPIVPIRIHGVDTLLPIGKFWPRFVRPRVIIGEPIRITSESAPLATKRFETVIRSML